MLFGCVSSVIWLHDVKDPNQEINTTFFFVLLMRVFINQIFSGASIELLVFLLALL